MYSFKRCLHTLMNSGVNVCLFRISIIDLEAFVCLFLYKKLNKESKPIYSLVPKVE